MIADFKPYPDYKALNLPWLGKIPTQWTILRAKNVFHTVDVRSEHGSEELLTVSAKHGVVPRRDTNVTMFKAESYVGHKLCWPGDLVINSLWAWMQGLGFSNHHGLISSAYSVFRPRPNFTQYARYLHYTLRSAVYKWELLTRSKGVWLSRLQLSDPAFLQMPILLPDEGEALGIVRFLHHIDQVIRDYIRAKQKLIALLSEQKQVVLNEIIKSGQEIASQWRKTRLKYVAKVQTGITLGKNYDSAILVSRPYLRVANVQNGFLDLNNLKTVAVLESEAHACTLRAGDVLMTEGGDIDKLGRGCVWRDEIPFCLHQNHIFAVRTDQDQLLPEFLSLLMASAHGRTYFQSTAKQTTNLASTNGTTIKNFGLCLPEINQQFNLITQVTNKSNQINKAIANELHEIDLLRAYHSRLVADVVTGKLDTREVAAKLPKDMAKELETIDEAIEEEAALDPELESMELSE